MPSGSARSEQQPPDGAARTCSAQDQKGGVAMRGTCLVLFAACVVLVNGGAVSAEEKKKDEELIQGTWTVVSREFVGKKTPRAELLAVKVTLEDGTITID